MAIPVSPPRAAERNWLSRLRYSLATCHRSLVQVPYQEELRGARIRSPLFYPLLVSGSVPTKLFRALVPGMAQSALGRRAYGMALLGLWLLLFAAGLRVADPFWWWQLFGMSAAVRVVASIDLAFQCSPEIGRCDCCGAIQGLMSFVAVDCVLQILLLGIVG